MTFQIDGEWGYSEHLLTVGWPGRQLVAPNAREVARMPKEWEVPNISCSALAKYWQVDYCLSSWQLVSSGQAQACLVHAYLGLLVLWIPVSAGGRSFLMTRYFLLSKRENAEPAGRRNWLTGALQRNVSLMSLPCCCSHRAAGRICLDDSLNSSLLVLINLDWILCIGSCLMNHLTHQLGDPNSLRRRLRLERIAERNG